MVYGGTFGLLRLHMLMFVDAKSWWAAHRAPRTDGLFALAPDDEIEAWASDTFGALILSGPVHGWWMVSGALFLVGIAWFLLPR